MNAINLNTTINSDGFSLSGGATSRALTVTGGDVVIDGGGDVDITFPSSDATLATLALPETLSNKTLASPSFSGTIANLGTVTTADINGGTLDGVIIGGSSPAAATITTLTITSFAANWTNAGRTVADLGVVTTVDINGGTIDGTTIGGSSAAAGSFTTVGATGLITSSGGMSATVTTVGVTLALTGANSTTPLAITIDSSSGAGTGASITTLTNFAHAGNLLSLTFANSTDSGKGLIISNAGGGNALDITQKDSTEAVSIKINATQANVTAADTFIAFKSTSGTEGFVAGTAGAGTLLYQTFSGGHMAQSNSIKAVQNPENARKWTTGLDFGTVLVSTDELCQWEGETNTTLPKVEVSSVPEDKRVYGVYAGADFDGDLMVLALGTGAIKVNMENGDIEVGDFLCSSSEPGVAMKYVGVDMRVVIAKARESAKVSKLIACTVLAG